MKNKHIIDLLIDYLDGVLDIEKEAEVKAHLRECPSCEDELNALKKLQDAFKEEKPALPSQRLKTDFYRSLAREIEAEGNKVKQLSQIHEKRRTNSFAFLRIAAGIALLIGSFFAGQFWKARESAKEIAALETTSQQMRQTAMFSLMENRSASKRIQGVGYAEELPRLDPEIIEALIDRVKSDDNYNVRLAALDALGKFTDSEIVKDALIKILKSEKDPNLQIQIIQILADIQEKKAVKPMQELLENENTEPYVKDHIKSLLPSIS